MLNLQTFFTAGKKEVRAWTIQKGNTASQAAGVIHSDFEKGFIRAEVISYENFIDYKNEIKVREAGKLKIEGKDYIVKDGDIMHLTTKDFNKPTRFFVNYFIKSTFYIFY